MRSLLYESEYWKLMPLDSYLHSCILIFIESTRTCTRSKRKSLHRRQEIDKDSYWFTCLWCPQLPTSIAKIYLREGVFHQKREPIGMVFDTAKKLSTIAMKSCKAVQCYWGSNPSSVFVCAGWHLFKSWREYCTIRFLGAP